MRNEFQKRAAPGARPGLSKEIKEKDFPAAENSLSALERQSRAACLACSFFRAVDLPSGRVRRLCMLSGERLNAAATPCEHFMPGRWETTWADPATPQQSFLCRACAHGIVPHIRAALLGLVGCMAGRVPDGAAYPVHCRDFRAKGARHAA